jgi:hypothetical protein
MEKGSRLLYILLLTLLPTLINAQDSIRLVCPLNEAVVVPPPKNAMHYDPPDLCIALSSKPDTSVKACVTGKVTNTEVDDDGKYGVVIFCKYKGSDYYFWYTGLAAITVKRNDVVKAGQSIGTIASNDKIEMLMYNFETPMDPSLYLQCKGILVNAPTPAPSGNHP